MRIDLKYLSLRLPLDLWRSLVESARNNGRSLNSEIIMALKKWLGI